MRYARLAVLLVGLAPVALAQPELPRTVAGDLDGDGVADRVELRRSDEAGSFVDVTVFLSKDKRTLRAKSLAGISTGKDGTIKVDSCDADFAADRALRNGKPAAAPGRPVSLEAWNDDSIPAACQF